MHFGGQDMPGFGTLPGRRGVLSLFAPEGWFESTLPAIPCIPLPGADGRTGAGQPIHARRVQGTHPVSTVWDAGIVARSALQGSHTPQNLLILSCWHPGKTGPQRAESRYHGASFGDLPGAESSKDNLPAGNEARRDWKHS